MIEADQFQVRVTVTVIRGDRVGQATRSVVNKRMSNDETALAQTSQWIEDQAVAAYRHCRAELAGREAR